MDKSKLLDQCGALGEDRTLLARVLDRAKQASERNIPAATDFLSPAQQAQAADLLHAAGIPETASAHRRCPALLKYLRFSPGRSPCP